MTAQEYLATLTNKSAWVFTKQDASFEEAVKATKLFADICYDPDVNVEQYFADHHQEYGIRTDRHRVLVIAQLYGLITKTPFYTRGNHYNKERPTEIFDLIKNEQVGSELYNKIKTEQILKLKIHSIIDTANNNEDYSILPVVFIYMVLKKLQTKYKINAVSIGHFWTYIATSKSYSDVDKVAEFIASNAPISQYFEIYKGNSRILTIIRNNISLFTVTADVIAINPEFDNYFFKKFIKQHDADELHDQLLRDIDYSYMLYNNQHFNIDLVDVPVVEALDNVEDKVVQPVYDEETDEREYLEKVDAIKEDNVNEDIALKAYDVQPIAVEGKKGHGRRPKTNPILGKIAITRAYYCCEFNHDHETFMSNRTHKQYMEAHHLIPVANQEAVWNKYHKNIDCVENLVSLCPNCHKAFHYGTKEVKARMIETLFNAISHKYRAIGLNIPLEEIKKIYGVVD